MPRCPLCRAHSREFHPDYFLCPICDLRFLSPSLLLTPPEEAARYDLHRNLSTDPAYQRFVGPAVEWICERIPLPAFGLDFGCGADSAVIRLLSAANYEMSAYDPQYFPNPSVLERKYDFVVATEVIEHLHRPDEVFTQLRSLLKPQGSLILMTHLFSAGIDFANWYYRRDPTHVVFYSEASLAWIQQNYDFATLEIREGRTIWLQAR